MCAWLLKVQGSKFLFSVAGSYVVTLGTLVLARGFGLAVASYLAILFVLTVAFGGIAWWRNRAETRNTWRGMADRISPIGIGQGGMRRHFWLVPGALTAVWIVYLAGLGPYTEIPADAWWHLGKIQDALETMNAGALPQEAEFGGALKRNGDFWYFLPAVSLHLAGLTLKDALGHIATVNTVLLLGAVYSFGLYLFRQMGADRTTRHAMAAASMFFFSIHFGVNVFSYIRYYTFAPTFLNYVLYLAAVATFARFTQDKRIDFKGAAVLVALVAAMALVHLQEAMFTCIMAFIILIVAAWQANAEALRSWWVIGARPRFVSSHARRLAIAAVIAISGALVFWVYLYLAVDRSNPLYHNYLVPLEYLVPFLKNLYILNPTYQFYQVVTIWGVVVYLLYIANYRTLRTSNVLTAGMLAPLFTVFNPAFIDLFLRVHYADLVWRLCFMLPLAFVAGYIMVHSVAGLGRMSGITRNVGRILVAVLLVGLLAPIRTTFVNEPYSRLETLRASSLKNDYRHWEDMLDFLGGIESKGIITDRVTGYMINGLTHHYYPGFKFFGNGAVRYNLSRYGPDSFRDCDGWVVVVNRRDGVHSRVGAISRHWSPAEAQVSRHYDQAFVEHLERNPGHFVKLWERDRIAVYRIAFPGQG